MMLGKNAIPHSTVMVRMARMRHLLNYKAVPHEDFDLWMRLLFKTKDPEPIFYQIQQPLGMIRYPSTSTRINSNQTIEKVLLRQQKSLQTMFPTIYPKGYEEPPQIVVVYIYMANSAIGKLSRVQLDDYKIFIEKYLEYYTSKLCKVPEPRKKSLVDYFKKMLDKLEAQKKTLPELAKVDKTKSASTEELKSKEAAGNLEQKSPPEPVKITKSDL